MFRGMIELRELTMWELREYRDELYWLDAEYGRYAHRLAAVVAEIERREKGL